MCVHVFTHVYMCVCMCMCTHVCVHTCICVCVHACTLVYVCAYMCVHTHVCACLFICVAAGTNPERNLQEKKTMYNIKEIRFHLKKKIDVVYLNIMLLLYIHTNVCMPAHTT